MFHEQQCNKDKVRHFGGTWWNGIRENPPAILQNMRNEHTEAVSTIQSPGSVNEGTICPILAADLATGFHPLATEILTPQDTVILVLFPLLLQSQYLVGEL